MTAQSAQSRKFKTTNQTPNIIYVFNTFPMKLNCQGVEMSKTSDQAFLRNLVFIPYHSYTTTLVQVGQFLPQ